MAHTYSTYEAKAKFSEVIRKVKAGQRIVIAYRGEEIAEIRPIQNPDARREKAIARLEDQGVVGHWTRARERSRGGSGSPHRQAHRVSLSGVCPPSIARL
jgi:prevent-host-death family protein